LQLVKIIEEQERQRRQSEGTFDNSCILFVCNKWDIVKERDSHQPGTEDQVWNDTLEKLQKYFPDFRKENVFKMSVNEVRHLPV